jgi:hypothetical protein
VVTALLGERFSARALALWASAAAVVSLGLLAIMPDVNPWLSGILLTAAAFFGAVHTPLMADGRSMLPARFAGRGLGLLNFFVFLGIGTINAAIGLILQYVVPDDPARAYRVVFVTVALILGAALTIYAFGRRYTVNGDT